MRFALLSRNAKINVSDKSAVAGNANSRLQFFPDCTNSQSKYVFFFGNESEIQSTVKGISFTPNDPASPGLNAAYYVDQVSKDKIDAYGMMNSEDPSTSLTGADGANCLNGFTT